MRTSGDKVSISNEAERVQSVAYSHTRSLSGTGLYTVVMGVRRNFSRGGAKSTFWLSFSGCWRCNANGRTRNASPFLHHKENVQCYGNSCIQCFPSKKILH